MWPSALQPPRCPNTMAAAAASRRLRSGPCCFGLLDPLSQPCLDRALERRWRLDHCLGALPAQPAPSPMDVLSVAGNIAGYKPCCWPPPNSIASSRMLIRRPHRPVRQSTGLGARVAALQAVLNRRPPTGARGQWS